MPEKTHDLIPPPPASEAEQPRIQAPRTFTGSMPEACQAALNRSEPVFVPVTTFNDDRGWSMMNLMTGVLREQGQINFSIQYPGVIKAWHRHDRQTDFWVCAVGNIKAGIYRGDDGARWMQVIGEQRPGVLIIPPPLWHGAATVGPTPAGLLYYVTEGYNPDAPDEHRRPFDSVRGFPWGIRHG
ncbi:MAG: dTDP-4-dehydrorhamnose 3,5-epimerase family protein [Phycisphaerales bacterium]|nr:MAG: dTDP-4-dehydrorhamnose 3,5-epimerase family protein [Phycisphaerales bacterium]